MLDKIAVYKSISGTQDLHCFKLTHLRWESYCQTLSSLTIREAPDLERAVGCAKKGALYLWYMNCYNPRGDQCRYIGFNKQSFLLTALQYQGFSCCLPVVFNLHLLPSYSDTHSMAAADHTYKVMIYIPESRKCFL